MDLEQLSVVIPTYQRPVYALRNMRLLDETGMRVHVLDGSTDPIDPADLVDLSPRINYLHLPVSYEDRMARAMELVDTPFCVALGDDDMHLPSGLRAALEALEADPELVAVTGTALEVSVRDGTAQGRVKYDGLPGRAVMDDDPIERMVDHLGRYLPSTVYAVTRTPVWVRAAKSLTGKRFRPFRLGELQYEMTVAYAGKFKVVPHVMWLRSVENRSLWLDDDIPLAPWWVQATESGERADFATYMGAALTDDPTKQADASKGALRAMDTYIRAVIEVTAQRARLNDAQRRERWPSHPMLSLVEWGSELADDGVRVDHTELAVAARALEDTAARLQG